MKEIKFRIWNSFAGVMESWEDIVSKNKIHLLSNQLTQYPVMQFTGLKDSDNIDIYEGDLIKNKSGRICKAVWKDRLATFDATVTMSSWRDTDSLGFRCVDWPSCVKVIGNIYENPELIS